MATPSLAGRVAVVTGAGRGIGRAHAIRLADYGARVVVNDPGVAMDGTATGETPAQQVVAEVVAAGGQALADTTDISTMVGGRSLIERALGEWGAVDIVVNNAGIGRPRMVFNLAEDDWDDVVRVHLKGTFAVSQAACQWWRSEAKAGRTRAGRLINTATGLLLYGGAGQSNYVAAKAGVAAFTEAVATEMQPYSVTVNTVMPSAQTRMAAVGWRMDRIKAATEAYDATDPVHVAEFVCYLASTEAGWINGQCFQVRGAHVEHVVPYSIHHEFGRDDRGWTAEELVTEVPRMFGAGAKRADPPPAEWRDDRRPPAGTVPQGLP